MEEEVDPSIINTKMKILEILYFIMDVRLDLRITNLLVIYKREWNKLTHDNPDIPPNTADIKIKDILTEFNQLFQGK